ncbi:MAG: SDR family oxidoreductase [Deltaproteobacteria bacterium]|nr:SDR family oxidoreductase [Deltaproteobacteria bacterium]MBW2361994.1 SDR family oxidoreductase [Deltaproteobacteria bacterium]
MDVNGKHVVISGASGGLGRVLCRQLIEKGARVTALDLNRDELAELTRAIPSDRFQSHRLDVTDVRQCREILEAAVTECGDADLLINNAGITHFSSVLETDLSIIDQVMAVNFSGSVNCSKLLLPGLIRRRGMIVAVSSVAGFTPLHGRCAYAASKHAMIGFFATLRAEVAEQGVRVMIVCPSFVATQQGNLKGAGLYEGTARPGQASQTIGKSMTPEEAASIMIRAIERESRFLPLGRVARVSWWVSRLFPTLLERIMIRQTRREVESH